MTPIVASLSQSRAVTLLESRADDEVTGVLAIFRTKGIAGVYCVGTTPEHRREGVATSLLSKAKEIADSEGRALVLQTLKSDGVLNFYLDRGFEPLYTKAVLEKRLK
ncbi:MAG: GNAT family N-acetyltransferase [Nitrososphaerota archaeon]|nr:GNAT family N-acetyltransferase [Nitrososphaerota archaeon]